MTTFFALVTDLTIIPDRDGLVGERRPSVRRRFLPEPSSDFVALLARIICKHLTRKLLFIQSQRLTEKAWAAAIIYEREGDLKLDHISGRFWSSSNMKSRWKFWGGKAGILVPLFMTSESDVRKAGKLKYPEWYEKNGRILFFLSIIISSIYELLWTGAEVPDQWNSENSLFLKKV